MKSPLLEKNVLVLGLGESGLGMALWLARLGANVRVADSRESPPHATELKRLAPQASLSRGAFDNAQLAGVSLLALSPGLPSNEPLVVEARRRGITVTGEIELFAQALRQLGVRDKTRVIAITGTNGKTTVTSMAGAMCRAAGKRTEVAGNISPAALTALMACLDTGRLPDVWVLEVSSFQLETTETLNADAATVLNVTDDHLDRYADINAYAATKASIFARTGVQVLNRQDARVVAMALPGRRILSFGLDQATKAEDFGLIENGEIWLAQGRRRLIGIGELPLAGLHNVANALAALALCRAIDLPLPPLLAALRQFTGLPHRVEKIAEINGIAFYDDSKGTNVGATVAALEGLGIGRKVALIVGGEGKGQDFSPLKNVIDRHARAVVLIGRDAPLIEQAIAGCAAPLLRATDMDEAVSLAFVSAQMGDAVLLSPACASFDMYRDYVHRAETFTAAVRELAKQMEPVRQ